MITVNNVTWTILFQKLARLELNDRRDDPGGEASGHQQLLQHEMDQARKEGDDLKVQSLQLERELNELKVRWRRRVAGRFHV